MPPAVLSATTAPTSRPARGSAGARRSAAGNAAPRRIVGRRTTPAASGEARAHPGETAAGPRAEDGRLPHAWSATSDGPSAATPASARTPAAATSMPKVPQGSRARSPRAERPDAAEDEPGEIRREHDREGEAPRAGERHDRLRPHDLVPERDAAGDRVEEQRERRSGPLVRGDSSRAGRRKGRGPPRRRDERRRLGGGARRRQHERCRRGRHVEPAAAIAAPGCRLPAPARTAWRPRPRSHPQCSLRRATSPAGDPSAAGACALTSTGSVPPMRKAGIPTISIGSSHAIRPATSCSAANGWAEFASAIVAPTPSTATPSSRSRRRRGAGASRGRRGDR